MIFARFAYSKPIRAPITYEGPVRIATCCFDFLLHNENNFLFVLPYFFFKKKTNDRLSEAFFTRKSIEQSI